MSNFFKQCYGLLRYMFKYKNILISRWLRGTHEKKGKIFKLLKPLYFEEAVFCVCELASREQKFLEMFDTDDPNEFGVNCHHGIGQHIRNEWELWINKSPLYKDIQTRFNLFHADDMSGVILQTAWQRIKNKPETPALISMGYLFYWEDMKRRGEWDGIANGGMTSLAVPLPMRKEIEKEKKRLGY